MSTIIYALAIGIVVLFIVLLFIFIYLIRQRKKEEKEHIAFERYFNETGDKWFALFVEGAPLEQELIPKNEQEQKFVDRILLRYANNLTDEKIINCIRRFMENHLEEYYKKQLHSRKWSLRMNALEKILTFSVASLSNDVVAMVKDENQYTANERLLMYQILAKFHYKQVIQLLVSSKETVSEYEYRKIMSHFTQQEFESFIEQFDFYPPALQYAAIDLIGRNYWLELVPFLERLLEHEDNEIRIRSLKSIEKTGYVQQLELYADFAQSDNWVERLMMSKLLVYFTENQAYELLEQLMQDKEFVVRAQAAKTLYSSEKGRLLLQEIAETSTDRFAKELAVQTVGGE